MTIAVDVHGDGSVGHLAWELLEPFGVRLHVDSLGDGLDPSEQAALADLLYHHGFVEARGQDLDKAGLRRVGSYVAPLLPEDHEANPVLAVQAEVGGFGTRSLEFHRDLSYSEHPFSAIALHALDVNPGETSTYLANGVRAYQELPEDLRRRLDGLQVRTALHGRVAGVPTTEPDAPGWPQWVHPLVAPHPVTGAPVLFVCEMSSARIEGLEPAESEDLLLDLFARVSAQGNVYEHVWENGDLLLWDNVGCVHARRNLDGVSKRTLQRLTMGRLSFPMAFPDFNMRDFTDRSEGPNYMGDGGGRF
jgi:taurine dioxygenase